MIKLTFDDLLLQPNFCVYFYFNSERQIFKSNGIVDALFLFFIFFILQTKANFLFWLVVKALFLNKTTANKRNDAGVETYIFKILYRTMFHF